MTAEEKLEKIRKYCLERIDKLKFVKARRNERKEPSDDLDQTIMFAKQIIRQL